MTTREQALRALLALVGGAYPWKSPPARRLRLWSDVALVDRPACFLFEGGSETYGDGAGPNPKRILEVKLFVYVDAHDPSVAGASLLNAILDALDVALAPTGGDVALGRLTLGGAAYGCSINGRPLKDPGDLDGDGLLVVPIEIVLP